MEPRLAGVVRSAGSRVEQSPRRGYGVERPGIGPDDEQAHTFVECGLRLGGALWHFWDLQGHSSEQLARLQELLATNTGAAAARAKALHAAAYLTYTRGDPEQGCKLAAETLAVGQAGLHPFLRASALHGLGLGALMGGDCARASALADEALASSRRAGERRGMYFALYGLAEVARVQGDNQRAVRLMDEARTLTLEQGDRGQSRLRCRCSAT